MSEHCGSYEIVDEGSRVVPADTLSKEWSEDTVWGRRWILCDDQGVLHIVTFGAELAFQDALDQGIVSPEVRRVFDTEGRSMIEDDLCHREPAALPVRVVLTPGELREEQAR